MNVESAIALASLAAGSAASEAGRTAWESLVSLARRVTGRSAEAEPTQDREALVGRIADRARSDDEFAARLCEWAAEHQSVLRVTHDQSSHTNVVSPGAQVTGTVIQARDISGDINL